MTVTAEFLKEANTALDLADTRYRLGLSSIVELSQAQLQQTQAQIADANARFEYEADLAALRFQSGIAAVNVRWSRIMMQLRGTGSERNPARC